jgi:hypothetical protein
VGEQKQRSRINRRRSQLANTVLERSDSLLVRVDGFVEGVEINGGGGTAILLCYGRSIEPENLLAVS